MTPNNANPRVGVIIPCYNSARYLADAIRSVQQQDYGPLEVIVVDDGSTDDTAEAARPFAPPVRYVVQPHGGIGAARNHGVELTPTELIAFLDADDVWLPDKLSRQIAALDRTGADMVLGHMQQFVSPDLDPAAAGRIYCPPAPMPGYASSTMLVRREAFMRVGWFGTQWRVGEWIDWYGRAQDRGLKTVMLSEVVTRRRLHETNQGVRERDSRSDYVRVVKAALDRRRAGGGNP